jgi:L-iditol 2-dehydrogenase
MTGVVVQTGNDVRDFAVGQRVVAGHHAPCFKCHYCRHGSYSMCAAFKASNLDPGGFAEYVRIPEANVRQVTLALPEDLTFEEGSFVEPLACCLRAVRRSPLQPGDSALVLGLGSIGLLMLQLFRLQEAAGFGADFLPSRRNLAADLGADMVGSPDDPNFLEEILQRTDGRGPDVVMTATESPQALVQALELVRNGGTVNLFGGIARPLVELDMAALYKRELALLSSYSSYPPDFPIALLLLQSRKVRVAEMVTHRYGLEGLGQAIDGMVRKTGIKQVILPHIQ